jgi:hypothetical protein
MIARRLTLYGALAMLLWLLPALYMTQGSSMVGRLLALWFSWGFAALAIAAIEER